MNKLIVVLIAMWMMFANVAIAEERSTFAFEAMKLSIKLSNDRTGIVQKVDCNKCDFNMVNITTATQAYANGEKVDLLTARSRAGKSATVIFYPDTREIQKITWVE